MSAQTNLFLLILGITILSGVADSQGFLHAAKIWRDGKLVPEELIKSALGFTVGIILYWLAIRFLQQVGVFSAETQTILWFGITLMGVAVLSGRFFRWPAIDQIVAVLVLAGIGWLLLRTGG